MKSKLFSRFVFFLLMAALAAGFALAASGEAKLEGVVVDETGQVVSEATVLITHPTRTTLMKKEVTDEEGLFEFIIKPVENPYKIEVTKEGHALYRGEIELEDGKALKIRVELPTLVEGADNPKAISLYNEGVQAEQGGDLALAVQKYEEALGHQADFPRAIYALAHGLYEQGKPAEALPHASRLLELEPAHRSGLLVLYDAAKAVGDQQALLKAAHGLAGTDEGKALAAELNNEAVDATNAREFAEAEQKYRLAAAFDDSEPAMQVNLASVIFAQGRVGEALGVADQVLKRWPENPGALEIRYMGLGILGNHKKSADALAKLLAASDKDRAAHAVHKVVDVLDGQGKDDAILAEFSAAAELMPDVASIRYQLGMLSLRRGQLDAAKEHFSAALELDPSHPDAQTARDILESL